MATKKAPSKKSSTTKAKSGKKPNIKKSVTKTVAKKKHPIARLLDFRSKGSITKKGLIISIAVVVVGVLAYAGVTVYQNMSANAGGPASLGRGWSYIGNSGLKGPSGTVTLRIGVCKTASSGNYKVRVRGLVIASTNSSSDVMVNIGTQGGSFYKTSNFKTSKGSSGNSNYTQAYSSSTTLYVNAIPGNRSPSGTSTNGTISVKVSRITNCL